MIDVNEVLNLIQSFHPETKIDIATDLFDTGYMDSFVIFSELVPTLMEKYNFEILPPDLVPKNFLTVEAITAFINSKL